MFEFLNKEEKKNKLFRNIQEILEKEVEKAKKHELLIGIDPETYLGAEILKQSREIIQLRTEIHDMKRLMAELINHLNK